jgi:hypothetical protein
MQMVHFPKIKTIDGGFPTLAEAGASGLRVDGALSSAAAHYLRIASNGWTL